MPFVPHAAPSAPLNHRSVAYAEPKVTLCGIFPNPKLFEKILDTPATINYIIDTAGRIAVFSWLIFGRFFSLLAENGATVPAVKINK